MILTVCKVGGLFFGTMVYQYFLCVLFLSSAVHGQISLAVPAAGYCGNTTKLTCTVTTAVATAHTWSGPSGNDIMIDGIEVGMGNRYSEQVSGNQFSLIIRSTNVATDEGEYTCTNGFDVSSPQTLHCHCVEGFTVSTDSRSMKIEVSEAYPTTISVKSVSLEPQDGRDPTSITVRRDSLTPNGDNFHVVWKSSEIDYGKYKYTVTIEALTEFVFRGDIEIPGTTGITATTTTITSPTPIMTTSSTTATTTSSVPTTSTSISTGTTKMLVSILTTTSTITASPRASSTVTSTNSTVKAPSASGDKALVILIIVVSVIGGVLIVAIFSTMFVMMHWKSCFTRMTNPKQFSQKSDHRKKHRQAKHNASGRFVTTQQDHVLRGYYFYNGTYKNPLFCDPVENSFYIYNYYPNEKNSHDP